ncbi:MAG: hypothetical protein ABL962_16430 [Fimbriimonadaceae bacterium]
MKIHSWLTVLLVGMFCVGAMAPVGVDAQVKPAVKRTAKKKKKSKKKPVVKKVVPPVKKVDPTTAPVVGTWFTIDSEGKFAKANKFVFTKFGDFAYTGPGFKSAGTFNLKAGVINLTWLSIDGQPVKPGTIKKAIPVAEKVFKIERFTYKWALL